MALKIRVRCSVPRPTNNMDNKRYQAFPLDEVMKNELVSQELKKSFSWFHDLEFKTGVFECVNNVPTFLIGTDGGEPEDQTLYRDWEWVIDALNTAYDEGYNTGWEYYRDNH